MNSKIEEIRKFLIDVFTEEELKGFLERNEIVFDEKSSLCNLNRNLRGRFKEIFKNNIELFEEFYLFFNGNLKGSIDQFDEDFEKFANETEREHLLTDEESDGIDEKKENINLKLDELVAKVDKIQSSVTLEKGVGVILADMHNELVEMNSKLNALLCNVPENIEQTNKNETRKDSFKLVKESFFSKLNQFKEIFIKRFYVNLFIFVFGFILFILILIKTGVIT